MVGSKFQKKPLFALIQLLQKTFFFEIPLLIYVSIHTIINLIISGKFTQKILVFGKKFLRVFEIPTNHIFDHTVTFYMLLAFRKCII